MLRTANMLERVDMRVKCKIRISTTVSNGASLHFLVSSVPMKISKDYEIGKVYLKPRVIYLS
jgi:hypothetical protein